MTAAPEARAHDADTHDALAHDAETDETARGHDEALAGEAAEASAELEAQAAPSPDAPEARADDATGEHAASAPPGDGGADPQPAAGDAGHDAHDAHDAHGGTDAVDGEPASAGHGETEPASHAGPTGEEPGGDDHGDGGHDDGAHDDHGESAGHADGGHDDHGHDDHGDDDDGEGEHGHDDHAHDDHAMHDGGHDDHAMHHDHAAMLVPLEQVTHAAIADGDWSDPAIWENGEVPGDGATVLIPEGARVTYDVAADGDAPRLEDVRVDGLLAFSTEADTQMIVDTLAVTEEGRLEIGTAQNPMPADIAADIVFTGDTSIYEDNAHDASLMGRGLVTTGSVAIYGADKTDHAVLAGDAMAGDDALVIDGHMQGWAEGDMLVLAGTRFDAGGDHDDNTVFHDEVLEITDIAHNADGTTTVRFVNRTNAELDGATTLGFDHERPDGFEDQTDIGVANLSRNISFRSEFGADTPIDARGHVMFMHNWDTQVQNAGFYDLGRTDKSKLLDSVGEDADGQVTRDGRPEVDPGGDGSNPVGRYALHFHLNGQGENSMPERADYEAGEYATASGNAIWGSPGWGLVTHRSTADFVDNVVFDVQGSGIVAEDGVEIGRWQNNFVAKTTGDRDNPEAFVPAVTAPPEGVPLFDLGKDGEAYWVQGAAPLEIVDNVAYSSNIGIVFFANIDGLSNSRPVGEIAVRNLLPETRDAMLEAGFSPDDMVDVSNLPVNGLKGFQAGNVQVGLETWAVMRNDDGQLTFEKPGEVGLEAHDARASFEDVTVWNVDDLGLNLIYTTQADFIDFLVLGQDGGPTINDSSRTSYGIAHNDPPQDLTFSDFEIRGFDVGFLTFREGRVVNNLEGGLTQNLDPVRFEDLVLADNNQNFGAVGATFAQFGAWLEIAGLTVEADPDDLAPQADFTSQSAATGKTLLDARGSVDADLGFFTGGAEGQAPALSGNGIVAYAWDFGADGTIDDYGVETVIDLAPGETLDVALTVIDSQGLTHTVTRTVEGADVAPNPNRLFNGALEGEDFGDLNLSGQNPGANLRADVYTQGFAGLNASFETEDGNGFVTFGAVHGRGGLGHTLHDRGVSTGEHVFAIDLAAEDGGDAARGGETVRIQIFGAEGEFDQDIRARDGLLPKDKASLSYDVLLDERIVVDGGLDWTRFSFAVDLGDGYDWIVAQIVTEGFEFVDAAEDVLLDTASVDDLVLVSADAPMANDDFFAVAPGSVVTLDPLGNDADGLTLVSVSGGEHGEASVRDGLIEYRADGDVLGTDTLIYTVMDAEGRLSTAAADVFVTPVDADEQAVVLNFNGADPVLAEDDARHVTDKYGAAIRADARMYEGAEFVEDGGIEGGAARFYGNGGIMGLAQLDATFLDASGGNQSDQLSLAFWMRPDASKFGEGRQIVVDNASLDDNRDADPDFRGLSVRIEGEELVIAFGDNSQKVHSFSVPIEAESWTHVAVSLDETAGTFSAYVDGVEIGSASIGKLPDFGAWVFGANAASNGRGYWDNRQHLIEQHSYSGMIDNLTMLTRAIDADEAAALASRTETPPASALKEGTSGDDVLVGDERDEIFLGLQGDDLIRPGGGADVVDGGAGTDTVSFADAEAGLFITTANPWTAAGRLLAPDARWSSDAGDHAVHVRALDAGLSYGDLHNVSGFETPREYLDSLPGESPVDILLGVEVIEGTQFGDDMRGRNDDNTFFGLGGNDFLDGGDGADVLDGGAGADRIAGGTGDDVISGGADDGADDILFGGRYQWNREGSNTVDETGADAFLFDGDFGNDTVRDFKLGVDRLVVDGKVYLTDDDFADLIASLEADANARVETVDLDGTGTADDLLLVFEDGPDGPKNSVAVVDYFEATS